MGEMKKRPKWTVLYNINRNGSVYIGKGWEFFNNGDMAQRCYDEQVKIGNVPTKRPFHTTDKKYMQVCDLKALEDEEKA